MPLYVYKCNNCEHQFEVRQRFSDKPLTDCPKCAGQIRRVINPVGVVFKGSGFYVTDSRNGKAGSLVNGKAQTEEKSEKKSEDKAAKTDAVPAATSKADKKTSADASGAAA